MGETFKAIATDGPLLLAIAVAALAGLVSFLSPCVLPLMPGYLSYVTGLVGSDLDATPAAAPPRVDLGLSRCDCPETSPENCKIHASQGAKGATGVDLALSRCDCPEMSPGNCKIHASREAASREVASREAASQEATRVSGRVLAGTSLFVLGFAVVFTLLATLVANIGIALQSHKRVLDIVLGVLVIILGLAFMGLVPGMQREFRIRRLPDAGLAGAPVFGALFGLSWMPCVGPTLGAVLGLATTSGQTDRAVVLALAYSLGLGLPFVLFGLFFRKLIGVFRAVRRNSRWVTRIGGALLILVGLALVTGGWNDFLIWLLTTFNFQAGTLL